MTDEAPKPVHISFGPDGKPRVTVDGVAVDADEFLAAIGAPEDTPDA
jgi:hypothetical protein